MIGTDCRRSDKFQMLRPRQQFGINPGYRTHQQHIGVCNLLCRHLTPWQTHQFAEVGEQTVGHRHIFINQDPHSVFLELNARQENHGRHCSHKRLAWAARWPIDGSISSEWDASADKNR